MSLTRRAFLGRSALIGCSAAASPLLTPVSFAAAPWDTRLVVIVLRGAMDGLDVVQPYGDPKLTAWRPTFIPGPNGGAKDLDGFFSLNKALKPLWPLWKSGELGFVHAVSTPYRDKRSHFEGQDLLEAGTTHLLDNRDGWLNRMLQVLPGVEPQTAFAIGHGEMRLLDGPAPVANWTPEVELSLSPQAMQLAQVMMEDDPQFHAAFTDAVMLSGGTLEIEPLNQETPADAVLDEDGNPLPGGMMAERQMMAEDTQAMGRKPRVSVYKDVAAFAAEQLRGPARVASFSINGWDSHQRQEKVLTAALGNLSDVILTLKSDLGPQIWGKTAVVAVTEFGRTVRENGTVGTDHGTGGAMLMAGGAIRGGKVYGRWPGLAEADLYEGRDLMPTGDVRAPIGWIMRGLTGLSRSEIESVVFPGLDMGKPMKILA
ncbi:DUF1501 domain-containing protein [Chachezhania sediminis]|uniref:DUF1501 domain-containing protein n=1 Tax=Chachezhania sediminis TaxID=2599291 RepID=UPI00131A96DD|nr:DUF1501 domain-containing protein [Chachezhania sediminis]